MQENQRAVYPGVAQSWGILGMIILSMILFTPVNILLNDALGKEISFLVYYLLAMGVPAFVAHKRRSKRTGNSQYQLSADSISVMLLLLLATIALQTGVTVPIAELIPMPDSIKELFLEFSNMNGFYAFLAIVIAAPVIEELIFRGIILDGLLQRHSPAKSIFLSSVLFGIAHLNPWQFISALVIGVFSGWVYYRTRKLSLSILIHAVNNGFAFLWMQFYDADTMMNYSMKDYYGGETNTILIIGGAIAISIFSIFLLKKQFSSSDLWQKSTDVAGNEGHADEPTANH